MRQCITDVVLLLENVQERRTRAGPQNVVAAPTGLVGRPKFDIPQEQLDYMLDSSKDLVATSRLEGGKGILSHMNCHSVSKVCQKSRTLHISLLNVNQSLKNPNL